MTAPQIICRNCRARVQRAIRCSKCDECPICCGKSLLLFGDDVAPCYNCNPDGMEVSDAALTAAKERADRAERLVKDLKRLGEEAFTGLNLYKAENRQLECALTAAKADVDRLTQQLRAKERLLVWSAERLEECISVFDCGQELRARIRNLPDMTTDAARAEKGEQKG